LGKGGLMQLDRKTLAFLQLPATKGDLYAPSGVKGLVQSIILHNTNTSDETVVINYHDGTSEFEVFNQVIAAGATLVWDFRGAGDVVEDGAKYTGNTDTATKVTLKVVGTEEGPSAAAPASSVAGVSSNLWAPPATPHDEDDEFEETTLSGWTGVRSIQFSADGYFSYDTVDAYDTTVHLDDRLPVNVHGVRRSWAIVQPPSRNRIYSVYKAYTLPTNLLVIARMKFSIGAPSIGNNDATCGICLTEATAGKPQYNSRVAMVLNEADSDTTQAQSYYQTSGGTISGSVNSTDIDLQGQALEYVAIHKIGTTFHCWAGTAGGNWIYFDGYSGLDFTPDMVSLEFSNFVANNPAVKVMGIDFIRFYETDNFLF
jgi:hypothetical protein